MPGLVPEVCSFKEGFIPPGASSVGGLGYPINNVDWCEAATFCAWAGKRLCRGEGQPAPSANNSEFYAACSDAGQRRFPWGNEPQPLACNARCKYVCNDDLREKVGTRSTCEGGVPGVFDLGGNQLEWTDWCQTDQGYTSCVLEGGYWQDRSVAHENDNDAGDCGTFEVFGIKDRWDFVGFRCCSDALPE